MINKRTIKLMPLLFFTVLLVGEMKGEILDSWFEKTKGNIAIEDHAMLFYDMYRSMYDVVIELPKSDKQTVGDVLKEHLNELGKKDRRFEDVMYLFETLKFGYPQIFDADYTEASLGQLLDDLCKKDGGYWLLDLGKDGNFYINIVGSK